MTRCLSLKTIENRPFRCKYEAYHGDLCQFEPVRSFGFIVRDNERQPSGDLEEGDTGTLFVSMELATRRIGQDDWKATLYYKANFAKDQLVTIEQIKARFPRSFAYSDAGEEYAIFRAVLDNQPYTGSQPEATPDQPGNFPKVMTPDGLQYTFGASEDSPVQPSLF